MTRINFISKVNAWLMTTVHLLLFLMPASLWGQPSGTGSQGGGFSQGANFENFSLAGATAPVARNLNGGNFSSDVGFLFTTPLSTEQYLSLNLQSANPERGSVAGEGLFAPGTVVTATAVVANGYRFVSWKEGDFIVSSQPEYSFILNQNRTLTAFFAPEIYTVTLESSPANNVGGGTTGAGNYSFGSQATVNALPNAFFTFGDWTDDNGVIQSTQASYTFTVTGNHHLIARFEGESYDITVDPSANGTTTGSGTYYRNEIVQAEATASEGWYFLRWMDGDSQVSVQNPYLFSASAQRTLVAEFAEIWWTVKSESYLITADVFPVSTGIVMGQGFYQTGTIATIMASPNQGITFVKWMEEDEDITYENGDLMGHEYSFTASGNRNLKAIFSGDVLTVEAVANPAEGGTTTVTSGGEFFTGDFAQVTATNNDGYNFVNWQDADSGMQLSVNPTHGFSVTENRNIVANFDALQKYNLELKSFPENAGFVEGYGEFFAGSNAEINALPSDGFVFLYWASDDELISSESATDLIMPASNVTLTAYFGVETFTLTFSVTDGSQPITDAVVSLNDTEYDAGIYSFSGLEAGNYSYRIFYDDYEEVTGNLDLKEDMSIDVVMNLNVATHSLYLLGDATTVGWDANNALEMEHKGNGLFEIVADIVEGPHIKFISVLGQWQPQWGTDATGISEGGNLVYQASATDPESMAIPAPSPGQYRIVADTVNRTYTITSFNTWVVQIGQTNIILYPNPARDEFNIVANKQMHRIVITDTSGRTIFNEPILSDHKNISLTNFSTGIYLIRIYTDHGVKVEKLVVDK